jgi:predicted trehalose synthase
MRCRESCMSVIYNLRATVPRLMKTRWRVHVGGYLQKITKAFHLARVLVSQVSNYISTAP